MTALAGGILFLVCGISAGSFASRYDGLPGAGELIGDAEKSRKIEVCGARALKVDTLSNFDDRATGWFPGRAKILADPHEALLAKLILIQKAKRSVDVSTFIFSSDEASMAILDALRLALLRGVNVRFMIDGAGSFGEALTGQYRHLRTLLLARKEMAKAGLHVGTVDVVVFHPMFRLYTALSNLKERFFDEVDVKSETALNWNRRSHDKIFMIDRESREDAIAIVGGRNIDMNYYVYPKASQDTYEDLEVIVANDPSAPSEDDARTVGGSVGRNFQNLFCSKGNLWLSLQRFGDLIDKLPGEKLSDRHSRKALLKMEGAYARIVSDPLLRSLYSKMTGKSGFDYFERGFVTAKLSPGNEIQNLKRLAADVFVDPNAPFIEKLYNGDSIDHQVRQLIRSAVKTIDICSPYIFLSQSERDCLKKWVMDRPGRRIRILSASTVTSDSPSTFAAFHYESAPELLREGPYRCEDPTTHEISEGVFNNRGSKIQVYQFGRLDNLVFKNGTVRDHLGQFVKQRIFYGKLHGKFGVIDGRYSFIGSHNLDQRSRRLNSETAFFLDSPKIAEDTTREFEKLLAQSYLFEDPDLRIMNERGELESEKSQTSLFLFISKYFPAIGYAN